MPAAKQAMSSRELETKRGEVNQQIEKLKQELAETLQLEVDALLARDESSEALTQRARAIETQLKDAERALTILAIGLENARADEAEEIVVAEKRRMNQVRTRYKAAIEQLVMCTGLAREAQANADSIYREFGPRRPGFPIPEQLGAPEGIIRYADEPFRMWLDRTEQACKRL